MVTLRAIASAKATATAKQNLPFPFSKNFGRRKKDKKAKANFVLRVRYNTSKRLASKLVAYATPLAVFPCLANLVLIYPIVLLVHGIGKSYYNYFMLCIRTQI